MDDARKKELLEKFNKLRTEGPKPKAAKAEAPKPAPKAAAPAAPAGPVPTRKPKPEVVVGLPPDKLTENHIWGLALTKRNLLNLMGWGAIGGVLQISIAAIHRFLFPRVLFEPVKTFKAGYPEEYPKGTISTKYQGDQKVWIAHLDEGIVAISTICTHLGCTPRWLAAEDKFKCPCHGSGFTREGINFEGPAPRPLERYRIQKAEDGRLLIDKSIIYRWEKGEWGKPGSVFIA